MPSSALYFPVLTLSYREYFENIRIVDRGIEELISEIDKYFDHDGKTSYILTSDHGMTNWGKVLMHMKIKVVAADIRHE